MPHRFRWGKVSAREVEQGHPEGSTLSEVLKRHLPPSEIASRDQHQKRNQHAVYRGTGKRGNHVEHAVLAIGQTECFSNRFVELGNEKCLAEARKQGQQKPANKPAKVGLYEVKKSEHGWISFVVDLKRAEAEPAPS